MDTNERQSAHNRLIAWVLILALAATLLHARDMLARLWVNTGYLQLNQAQASGEDAWFDSALASFGRVNPDSAAGQRAWRGRGLAHWFQSHADEALAVWEAVPGMNTELRSWAHHAERARDYAAVRDWYRAAVRIDPDNGDNWYRLAQASARTGDAGAADHYYLRALSSPERAEFGRSNILTRLGELGKQKESTDWTAVLERFDEAIGQDEYIDMADFIASRMGRAEALEKLGRQRESLDEYLSVVRYSPDLYWANVHSGRLTWYVERDAETATAFLRKAIDIDGKPKWAYVSLGLIYTESGRPELAIPLFEKVLTIDPNDVRAREQLNKPAGDDEP